MSYAIFTAGGHQFRAEAGLTVRVPLLDAKPGDEVTFDQIALGETNKGAKVTAEVVRHGKDKKIRIFRFARRSGYRRKAGHRQDFTEVRIVKVG